MNKEEILRLLKQAYEEACCRTNVKVMSVFFSLSEKLTKLTEENEELKATISKLETLAENRGAFIDWVLEKYPEIVKEYNGFEKE